MKPLYTESEFAEAKSRDLLPFECKHCGEVFHKSKNEAAKSQLRHRKEQLNFCSNSCQRRYNTPRVTTECEQCGTPFSKRAYQFAKSEHHFCSRSCAATWRNLNKKNGTRRSKLEKWLEEQLTTLYPNLEFHFNQKDAIQSELDIFIPSLRLAFELNGIYHYEPIHGQDKLDAIQSNDKRKFAACHEAGISLCSIDTSHQKYFKEKSSRKFLKIITDIINSCLSDS